MMNSLMYFPYGDKEVAWLAARDEKLAWAMSKIGHVYREVNTDLFAALVHSIVGQQISTAAHKTVWRRLGEMLGEITAETLLLCSPERLQSCGITFKKAYYIQNLAEKVHRGQFNIKALTEMPDAEVIKTLSALKGVGVWTAEMMLLFCLLRPNVISFGDLAILRGMRMLYHHRTLDDTRFLRYARRYAPYASVASLYLWAIAGGALPELHDLAAKPAKLKAK